MRCLCSRLRARRSPPRPSPCRYRAVLSSSPWTPCPGRRPDSLRSRRPGTPRSGRTAQQLELSSFLLFAREEIGGWMILPHEGFKVAAGESAMKTPSKAARALALLLCAGSALAQYPSKPIRFIVGFPPGGSADPTTRIIGAALAQQLGQPVVVENRPGADSAIAAEMMTRQPPDGYTIMFASNSAMTAAVALRKQPAYDPLADFTPISMVGRATIFFYTHPSVPAATLKEFIEHARANPGKLNYGTGNPLSILSMAQLTGAAGLSMLHVPYKGEGPLMPDIIAGRLADTSAKRAEESRVGNAGR